MFTDLARRSSKWLLDPLSALLARTGISPNALTIAGFLLNVGVAYILSTGRFFWGGVALLAANAFDALDGALARATGRTTRFGAFLDSTLDRYSEAVVLLGLLVHFARAGASAPTILIFATMVGSLLVSYTRARAQGLGIECKEGLLTRMERVLLLALFLLINQMIIGLWVLAVLANLTALQRIYVVWRKTQDRGQKA